MNCLHASLNRALKLWLGVISLHIFRPQGTGTDKGGAMMSKSYMLFVSDILSSLQRFMWHFNNIGLDVYRYIPSTPRELCYISKLQLNVSLNLSRYSKI
jgi:hypothetical protein